MPNNCWMLPSNLICVLPEFDLSIIRSGSYHVLSRMKTYPICTPLMTFQNFNAFDLNSNKRWSILSFCKLFPENGKIPNSNSWIQRTRHNIVFIRMELSTHHIMTMTCYDVNTWSTLIVPNPHCLVITGWENPWKLIMEEYCSDIVDMTLQYKITSFLFVVPDTDISIITSRNE